MSRARLRNTFRRPILGEMNSQTHVLMGAALFGRKAPALAWAGAAGGIVPDLPMYAIVAALGLAGHPAGEIFGRLYWQPWWQVANAVGHSFLLWGTLSAVALLLLARRGPRGAAAGTRPAAVRDTGAAALLLSFSGSALVHSAIDFLVHRDDAHMHFWPLSQWRFRSPVSYWDPRHHGDWFGAFEAMLGIALAIVLFRRTRSPWLRTALLAALALYVAMPLLFLLHHHG